MASYAEKLCSEDEYRCAYCRQYMDEKDDQRILPCDHYFCQSCVSSDHRQASSLECKICSQRTFMGSSEESSRVRHTSITERDLPRYIKEEKRPCSVCRSIAEKHCNQCKIYVCSEHALQHDEAFASTKKFKAHEKAVVISGLRKVFCVEHPKEEMTRVCSRCHKALCVECISHEKCSKDKMHSVDRIENLSEKLKKELMAIISELDTKSTALSDREKEASVILADHGRKFEEMKYLVDRETEKQIKDLQERSNNIKSQIDDTFKACTDAVNTYCAELMAKKDATDVLSRDIQNLISLRSDVEVIQDYQRTLQPLKEVYTIKPLELSIDFIEVGPDSAYRWLRDGKVSQVKRKTVIKSLKSFISDGRVTAEPEDLIHISSATSGCVYAVDWLPGRELTCGYYGKFERRDSSLKIINTQSKGLLYDYVYTISHCCNDYLALIYSMRAYKVNLWQSDFTYSRKIISGINGADSCHMAVKEKRVLVIDNKSKVIKLFRCDGTHLLDVDFKTYISSAYGIQFHDSNSFVVSDYKSGKVLKFKLEANKRPEWSCDYLNKPTGVAVDISSIIYVAGEAKTIYILSPMGALLMEFSPPELYDCLTSVSISDNDLAVGSKKGVQIFKVGKGLKLVVS